MAPVRNVFTEVAERGFCIGCGLCVALCPAGTLVIGFNESGVYSVRDKAGTCSENCNICLRVCPFSDYSEDEDALGKELFGALGGIRHRPETGYYLGSFVGYSKVDGHRENGASGGLVTFALEALLSEGLVDKVACVGSTGDPVKMFKYSLCSAPEEIRACSGSCYYPVEMSEVIGGMLREEGRYALVGLPCFCKGVRLAMRRVPALGRRVKFILGLVCGQLKSKLFAECVCALGGGDPHTLRRAAFRVKDPGRPASDFGIRLVSREAGQGEREVLVHWTEGVDRIWSDRYFTPQACNFCDDVFAEVADASYMDAWLPRYSGDPRGHSIVLVRNGQVWDILGGESAKGAIEMRQLEIGDVIASQSGVLEAKRRELPERSRLAEEAGQRVPKKRLQLCDSRLSAFRKRIVRLTWEVSGRSAERWLKLGKDAGRFVREFRFLSWKILMLRRIDQCFKIAVGVWRKAQRVLFH